MAVWTRVCSVCDQLRASVFRVPPVTSAVMVLAILLLSLPLTIFAIVTTTLAFWFLSLLALAAYTSLGLNLLKSWLLPQTPPKRDMPAHKPVKERSPQSTRASRSSSVGSDLAMRPPTKNASTISLAGSAPNRDFEGVGGWRLAGDEDEEALWMNINSRPDPPSQASRAHRRNSTLGGHTPGGPPSPDFVRTPLTIRLSSTAARPRSSGTASPESYFAMPTSRSAAALDGIERHSRVSFHRHSRSGSSSTASLGSLALTRYDAT